MKHPYCDEVKTWEFKPNEAVPGGTAMGVLTKVARALQELIVRVEKLESMAHYHATGNEE